MDLTKFNVADAAIATMAAQYLPLTIADVNDTQGADTVHKARMVVKSHRVDVEKTRKALKADALEYGRAVDAEAKRITGLLEPIEDHLSKQEAAYEAAKEEIRNAARLKAEAEERAKREAEEARLKAERDAEEARLKAERDAEAERLRIEREKLDADRKAMEAERAALAAQQAAERAKIEAEQAAERVRQKAEQDKIDAEHRRLAEIEREKLDAERKAMETERAKVAAEQAAERARQKAEQDKIDAEKQRLADIETARLRKIEDERIAAEAAERAKIETERRIAREDAEKKAAEEAKEAARLKAEALRPDREKLLGVASAVEMLSLPEISSDEGGKAVLRINRVLMGAETQIRAIIDELLPATEATNANH